MEAREVILALSYKYKFDWDDTYSAILNKEPLSEEDLTEAEHYFAEDKNEYITIVDKDYPEEFKHMYRPPFVIKLFR